MQAQTKFSFGWCSDLLGAYNMSCTFPVFHQNVVYSFLQSRVLRQPRPWWPAQPPSSPQTSATPASSPPAPPRPPWLRGSTAPASRPLATQPRPTCVLSRWLIGVHFHPFLARARVMPQTATVWTQDPCTSIFMMTPAWCEGRIVCYFLLRCF